MITKVAQLLKINECIFPQKDKTKHLIYTSSPVVCAVCRQLANEVYPVVYVFSESFTNFHFFTASDYICIDCSEIINNSSRKKHGFILHYDPETGKKGKYTFDKNETEQNKLWAKNFLLRPEKGFFTICYSSKSGKGHFLPYAKLNYSDGNIKSYLLTIGHTVYEISVKRLNMIYQTLTDFNLSKKELDKKRYELSIYPEYKILYKFSDIFNLKKQKKTN